MRQPQSGTIPQAGQGPARPLLPARSPDGAVWDIARLLVSESSPERVLEALANALDELVPYDALTVFQADLPLRVLRPVLCRDAYSEEILAMGTIDFGQGIAGRAVEEGTPALVNDAHLDDRALPIPGTPDEPESLIAVPLVSRGEPKGALCLYRLGEANHFTGDEFDLAMRFGQLAALALDNAQIRARLETEVVTDHLTGLHNHRYFHERLGEEVRRASRQRTGVGLLIYDLDDFKRVNDIHGHLAGDQVLQALAAVSRATARAEDVLCRIGGEEFAVILPGAGLDESLGLAERLRNAVATATFPATGRLTVSVGVAVSPAHSSSPRDLIACADLALLDAKATGKNRVCAFGDWPADGRTSRAPDRGELRSVAHLRLLQSLAAKLNRLHDVAAIGEAITVELRGLIDYHNCRIHLLQPDGELLVPIAFRGELTEYRGETFEALVTKVGEGITGWVAQRGRSYYSPNTADDTIAVPIAGTPDVDESLLVVPLRHGDRVVGTIALSKLGIDQFDQDDMRLLEVLASHAAVALENARLLQMERESSAELERAYVSTIEALANALEAKDEYTGDHARALAEMALAVGGELGLSDERRKMLELAALFHDIGKIGVPSEIIRKPGPLTAGERSIVRRHPEIGEQILAPVPFLQAIRPMVRACHERWDGQGYPDRLAAEGIPLEARIVFVCDAYHAMTTDRPYRAALPENEAVRRLRRGAGKQFDPQIVEAFVRLHGRGGIHPH
jgi:diguanylate cyclase (GGDEF)-like protein